MRIEDKGPIVAFHWRGAPDEEAARAAIDAIAAHAEAAGLRTHWGRKVLEVRPPVRIDKGAGIASFLADTDVDAALYVGDDTTDLDAFRALASWPTTGVSNVRSASACARTRDRRRSPRRPTSWSTAPSGVTRAARGAGRGLS